MSSTAALELLVQLNDQASKGLDDIGEKGGGMGDAIKSGVAIAGGAILGLGGILVGATKAAADDEAEVARLNNTLKNSIPNWDGNTAAVDALITKGQNLAFTDTEVRESMGFLVGQTGDLTEAQELQALAMDFARAKGVDLSVATKAVGKVDAESMGILKKYGIIVDDHATKEEALAAVRAQTAGQAETYANSAAGSMERVQNSLGEAFESIGGAILPLVSGPLAALADWFSSPEVQAGITAIAQGVGEFLSNAFTTLQSVISAVMPYIQPFIDAISTFFGTISGGGDIMSAFGQYFNDLGAAVANAWPAVSGALGTLLGNIVQWIIDNGPTILATLLGWATAFATWVWNDALPALLGALGGLITAVWNFIIENGPTILATLAEWTMAFFNWVWNDALPALLGALGGLIQGVWTFIVDNGPTILAKLWEWTQAFFNWVMNDLLPQVPGWLGNIIGAVWTFIVENGPTILQKLWEWTTAFFDWIFTDLLPQVPGWLLNIVSAVWTFISENVPIMLEKLAEWTGAFFDWVMNDVVPQIPTWFANIVSAIWTWIGETALSLGDKLLNEWLPAMWLWITGPGGVVEGLGDTLANIWNGITEWIGTTAGDIGEAVMDIGSGLVDGIASGISSAWDGMIDWLMGLIKDNIPDFIKDWLGIKSPSTVVAKIFEDVPTGMQEGVNRTFPAFLTDLDAKMAMLCDEDGAIQAPLRKLCDEDIPKILSDADAGLHIVGAGVADAVANGFIGAFFGARDIMLATITEVFGALWGEASKRAAEIYDLMTNGTAGNGTPVAGGPAAGAGGGTGGGRLLGATMAGGGITPSFAGGGGGGNNVYITVNAGWGSDGRGIAQAILEELEYALGDQIAIRTGSRTRP